MAADIDIEIDIDIDLEIDIDIEIVTEKDIDADIEEESDSGVFKKFKMQMLKAKFRGKADFKCALYIGIMN